MNQTLSTGARPNELRPYEMTDAILKAIRNMAVSIYAVGAGALVLVEQVTTWLSLISVLLGCIGAAYTIINQHRLRKRRKAIE